jgi:two-component system catabolic regulation response regulator CreB
MTDSPASQSAVILIVEDEPSIADTLIYALKTEGVLPVHCLTERAASEAFGARRPDLIILDVGLPDCNGFD